MNKNIFLMMILFASMFGTSIYSMELKKNNCLICNEFIEAVTNPWTCKDKGHLLHTSCVQEWFNQTKILECPECCALQNDDVKNIHLMLLQFNHMDIASYTRPTDDNSAVSFEIKPKKVEPSCFCDCCFFLIRLIWKKN